MPASIMTAPADVTIPLPRAEALALALAAEDGRAIADFLGLI